MNRNSINPAITTPSQSVWVRPTVQRLRAGAAEQVNKTTADGFNKS
jgi:hypothetical protein